MLIISHSVRSVYERNLTIIHNLLKIQQLGTSSAHVSPTFSISLILSYSWGMELRLESMS